MKSKASAGHDRGSAERDLTGSHPWSRRERHGRSAPSEALAIGHHLLEDGDCLGDARLEVTPLWFSGGEPRHPSPAGCANLRRCWSASAISSHPSRMLDGEFGTAPAVPPATSEVEWSVGARERQRHRGMRCGAPRRPVLKRAAVALRSSERGEDARSDHSSSQVSACPAFTTSRSKRDSRCVPRRPPLSGPSLSIVGSFQHEPRSYSTRPRG